MAKITVEIPDSHIAQVANAFHAAHETEPTLDGVRDFLLRTLRNTLLYVEQRSEGPLPVSGKLDFEDRTWGDLGVKTGQTG